MLLHRLPLRAAEALRSRTRGQALVETALVLPLLALLLVMTIDFGRVFFGAVALQNASRIGADYGASHADAWNGAPSGEELSEQAHYQELVLNDLQALNCTLPTPDPVPDPVFSGFDDGDLSYVELRCDFSPLTPLAEAVLGGPVHLRARSDFAVNRTINPNLPESEVPPPNLCDGPEASFTTDPPKTGPRVEITSGDEVEFEDSSTFEAGCPILTWSWDFDDGGSILDADTETVTTDVFTHSGSGHTDYTVRLTVTNAGGSDSAQVIVRADE